MAVAAIALCLLLFGAIAAAEVTVTVPGLDDQPAPQPLSSTFSPPATSPATTAGARLTEEQAKELASANPNVITVISKHPQLDRHAVFNPLWSIWHVTWTDPASDRQMIDVTIDDNDGNVINVDIKSEAWFDTLPLLTEDEAKDMAQQQPRVQDEIAGRENVDINASLGIDGVWTVSFFDGSDEIARVMITDTPTSVKEVMIGPQVAWQMARGYKGAFGRIINEPYVWLPLCLLFLAPFVDIRRPWRWIHLDLLVLLSFTVSHYFFNLGDIYTSVPLSYPPLVYLFVRLAWIGFRRYHRRQPLPPAVSLPPAPGWKVHSETPAVPLGGPIPSITPPVPPGRGAPAGRTTGTPPGTPAGLIMRTAPPESPAEPEGTRGLPHLNFSPKLLLLLLALMLIFRITINIADSNVVDVGYSGVIGAQRILDGQSPYGNMPGDDENGDTYGPMDYLIYVPFEKALPWSGSWDDLPAAHAAAICFDLAAVAGMFFAGRALFADRRRGNAMGIVLAYGWAAFPYTTFVLNCNVNDSIVAAFLIWGFVLLKRLPLAGVMLGFATAIKFFPALLGPLWASFPRAFRGWRRRLLFVLGFAIAIGVTLPVIFLGDGTWSTFVDRSLRWQIGRDSPFSIWGQHKDQLAGIQRILQYGLIALGIGTYFWPPRKTLVNMAALSAALIVGFQILLTHWFYLYIPWFFPLALIAFLSVAGGRERSRLAAAE